MIAVRVLLIGVPILVAGVLLMPTSVAAQELRCEPRKKSVSDEWVEIRDLTEVLEHESTLQVECFLRIREASADQVFTVTTALIAAGGDWSIVRSGVVRDNGKIVGTETLIPMQEGTLEFSLTGNSPRAIEVGWEDPGGYRHSLNKTVSFLFWSTRLGNDDPKAQSIMVASPTHIDVRNELARLRTLAAEGGTSDDIFSRTLDRAQQTLVAGFPLQAAEILRVAEEVDEARRSRGFAPWLFWTIVGLAAVLASSTAFFVMRQTAPLDSEIS